MKSEPEFIEPLRERASCIKDNLSISLGLIFKVRTHKIRVFRSLPPPCNHFDTYFLLFFYESLVSVRF